MEGPKMSVLVVSITDPQFEHRSGEVAYLANVLGLIAAQLQSTQGNVPSGSVLGVNWRGNPNTVVASYAYTPSGTLP
jgi:hypothetical protein